MKDPKPANFVCDLYYNIFMEPFIVFVWCFILVGMSILVAHLVLHIAVNLIPKAKVTLFEDLVILSYLYIYIATFHLLHSMFQDHPSEVDYIFEDMTRLNKMAFRFVLRQLKHHLDVVSYKGVVTSLKKDCDRTITA